MKKHIKITKVKEGPSAWWWRTKDEIKQKFVKFLEMEKSFYASLLSLLSKNIEWWEMAKKYLKETIVKERPLVHDYEELELNEMNQKLLIV